MIFVALALAAGPPVTPLPNAHAHNDYSHNRPLLDALAAGFCSFEADVFLAKGKLLVAHTPLGLRPNRDLETLYLRPLRARARLRGGRVYKDGPKTVYLLVDIKAKGPEAYAALHNLFGRYRDILSETRDGKHTARAVTVVISGARPRDAIRRQRVRYAGIDGRPGDLGSDAPAHLMPFISARWGSEFAWRGGGDFPKKEKRKLREIVTRAHRKGRKVRFWATPETPAVWRELRAADVDLINTDKLTELRDFLLSEKDR